MACEVSHDGVMSGAVRDEAWLCFRGVWLDAGTCGVCGFGGSGWAWVVVAGGGAVASGRKRADHSPKCLFGSPLSVIERHLVITNTPFYEHHRRHRASLPGLLALGF